MAVALMFILLTLGHTVSSWDNSWEGTLNRQCPEGQAVSLIRSYHSNYRGDRRWIVRCKAADVTTRCRWSGFVNSFGRYFNYNCPASHAITGVYSYHSNRYEDRRWKFRCCATQLARNNCHHTPWVNDMDEYFYWLVPGGNLMTGVTSYHSNSKEDRRWRFRYCLTTAGRHTAGKKGRASSGASSRASSTTDVYSGISEMNRNITGLIEGDIMVSTSRNAKICSQCKWKKRSIVVEVPYVIRSSFDDDQRCMITDAMNTFHQRTCIRFIPRRGQSDYLNIINSDGCWSWVGRRGGRQDLSLHHSSGGSCFRTGIIQHELLHALGFWHEQSRSDRDRYVRINWGNIIPKETHNFYKKDTNNLNTAYDYSSVMHYSRTALSKNGRDTITPKNPSAVIGQRVGVTNTDIQKVNKLYSCSLSGWDNGWAGDLNFKCPCGEAISAIQSYHSNWIGDRLWKFSCKTFTTFGSCQTSSYVNNFDRPFYFRCPTNQVITGLSSYHHNKDRRWKVTCCSGASFKTFDCRRTWYMNIWDERFKWDVPGGNWLIGINSIHSNRHKDRRWRFRYCQGRV